MMRKKDFKLGIVGGAGPLASCFLYKMLIEEAQRNYNAWEDGDFPEIILINAPFSPMMLQQELIQNNRQLIKELQQCFTQLANLGASHCVITCNTLHALMAQIDVKGMQFISLIEIASARCTKDTKTLILGTQTTRESDLYSKFLNSACYSTQSQETIAMIINEVLKGCLEKELAETLALSIKRDLEILPYEAVILGCTELSVLNRLFPLSDYFTKEQITIIDPLQLVTINILEMAYDF
jgi:aspartate racemase